MTSQARQIIQDDLEFVFEPDERRFARQLRARLLDEGCNWPLAFAQPRFYEIMLSGLREAIPPDYQPTSDAYSHAEFVRAMRLRVSKLPDAGREIALRVTDAIDALVREWRIDEAIFSEPVEQFTARLRESVRPFGQADLSIEQLRRRLYIALTTALLSKMRAREDFAAAFGSIPALLQAMQADHAEFCRFMAFCRERTPHVLLLASQTFWRTLETVRHER